MDLGSIPSISTKQSNKELAENGYQNSRVKTSRPRILLLLGSLSHALGSEHEEALSFARATCR